MFEPIYRTFQHLFWKESTASSSEDIPHASSNESTPHGKFYDKESSAKRIQQCFRTYVQKKGGLSQPSYDEYRQLIRQTEDMDKAEGGNTQVSLPRSRPDIVLKKSGRENAIKRFEQMEQVRGVLSKQKSSHLTVPQGAVVDDFVIEGKLPIQADRFYNMGLYIQNPTLFDEAVRELARMFSELVLTDIVSPQYHPSSNIVGDVVRHDNLPLYIEEKDGVKKGKIGFVDLEHIANRKKFDRSSRGYIDLARIFPFQLSILLEEAKKNGLPIDENAMNKAAEKGGKYLHEAYVIHDIWIRESTRPSMLDLNLNLSPSQFDKIAEQLQKELVSMLETGGTGHIEFLIKKYNSSSFLSSDYFSQKFREIIHNNGKEVAADLTRILLNDISEQLSEEIRCLSKNPERPEISLRSLSLQRRDLYNQTEECLKSRYFLGKRASSDVADQLLCLVFDELVKEKILFSFDPGFRSAGHEIFWVRF